MLSGIFIDGIPVFLNFLDKAKDNEIQLEKEDSSNKVVFIGDTMLSNISNCGFSKTKKSWCTEFSWGNQHIHFKKIDDALDKKPGSIIICVDTNDLTNDVNLLLNVKRIVSKTNRTSPNTSLGLSNIFEKMREI